MDNATIYAPFRFFPSHEQLQMLDDEAQVEVGDGPSAKVSWGELTLSIGTMPLDDVPEHLQGFAGYVRQNDGSEAVCSRVAATQSVFGVQIEPGFDDDGRAMRFIATLTGACDGLCFLEGDLPGLHP